jgi:acyl dehydratase
MIEREDVPAIPGSVAGTAVGALSTSLDARWMMAYSAALGVDDPRYYDTLADDGPIAHPLFSVCYEWPAVLALRAKAVRESWALLGVHSTHHVIIHRLPTAADRLLTRAQIIVVRPSRAGTLVVARLSTVDRNGRPVTTTDYGSVYRGVATEGEARVQTEPLVRPSPPASARPRWSAPVPVGSRAAHVYSECARIWNPIHTDIAVARSAGLTAPILHGSATLALAISQVIRQDLDGDPARVRRSPCASPGWCSCLRPSRCAATGARGDLLAFDAVDERGEPVLSDGVLRA